MTDTFSPVFVVGPPRSGTTLLQNLLAVQTGRFALPESHFFTEVLQAFDIDKDLKITSFRPQELKNKWKIATAEDLDSSVIRAIDDRLKENSDVDVRELYFLFLSCMVGGGYDFKTEPWIEKTPNHLLKVDDLRRVFPDAKVIAIYRHPLDTIGSQRTKLAQWSQRRPIHRLAFRWCECIDVIIKKTGTDGFISIRYEELVANLEAEVERICGFLECDFSAEGLYVSESVVKQNVRKSESWKLTEHKGRVSMTRSSTVLSIYERAVVALVCGAYCPQLGYDGLAYRLLSIVSSCVWVLIRLVRKCKSCLHSSPRSI